MLLVKPTPSNNFVRGWELGVHRGMDWGWQWSRITESRKILAAAPGVVKSIYDGPEGNGGWGRRIVIDHGNGIETTYNHIRYGGMLVRVGQSVIAGQHIANMGDSGTSKGIHLHFELYLNGVRVDPAPYFSKHLPGTQPPAGSPAGGTSKPPVSSTPSNESEEEEVNVVLYLYTPTNNLLLVDHMNKTIRALGNKTTYLRDYYSKKPFISVGDTEWASVTQGYKYI